MICNIPVELAIHHVFLLPCSADIISVTHSYANIHRYTLQIFAVPQQALQTDITNVTIKHTIKYTV